MVNAAADDDNSDVDHDGGVAVKKYDGNNSGNSNGGITTNWPERLFLGLPEVMIDAPEGIVLVFDRILDYCVPCHVTVRRITTMLPVLPILITMMTCCQQSFRITL